MSARFPAAARLIADETLPEAVVSATLTKNNSSSLGNYGGTVVAANHVGALVQPARQTLSAPSCAASAALSAIIIGLHSQVIQTRARASTARPRYSLNPLLDGLETVMPHP